MAVVIALASAPNVASAGPAPRPPASRQLPSLEGDLVRSYLRDIGRVPLLSHEQEITLGRQVQDLMALEELAEEFE
ncbi:sigma-70 factor domain-containing protein, partial [Cyanobium sp. Morenito 9A2]|uniref:sigma-70 factor domain-containing protein n=1 Tax=Cyanobium sp. Morenito 9A2 TaxID=2823718 RepID=UPI0029ECDAB2|nr:RNA polymerase sigma factor, RpoD/SigA family [Cyanobium sp. Morenito 9A2]